MNKVVIDGVVYVPEDRYVVGQICEARVTRVRKTDIIPGGQYLELTLGATNATTSAGRRPNIDISPGDIITITRNIR